MDRGRLWRQTWNVSGEKRITSRSHLQPGHADARDRYPRIHSRRWYANMTRIARACSEATWFLTDSWDPPMRILDPRAKNSCAHTGRWSLDECWASIQPEAFRSGLPRFPTDASHYSNTSYAVGRLAFPLGHKGEAINCRCRVYGEIGSQLNSS